MVSTNIITTKSRHLTSPSSSVGDSLSNLPQIHSTNRTNNGECSDDEDGDDEDEEEEDEDEAGLISKSQSTKLPPPPPHHNNNNNYHISQYH